MRDGGNTCTPVGSGAVDDQFWALICEDEDWLDSEFDQIVGEPAESPRMPPARLMVCADRSRPARSVRALADTGRDTRAAPGTVPDGPGGGNAHRPGRESLAGNRVSRWKGGDHTEREPLVAG